MTDSSTEGLSPAADVPALATRIVSAYVGNHAVAITDVPRLISDALSALNGLGQPEAPAPTKPEPAVPIKKSVMQDFIICLEDGKRVKMLRRYLQTRYDLSPDDYRRRWGLPNDYPMVAPAYAERRSALAKQNGLGRKAPPPPPVPEPAAPETAKRRVGGRKKKAA